MKRFILYFILVIIVSSPIYAICGDSLCGNDESSRSCPEDCQPEFRDYISCFFDRDTCTSDGLYEYVLDMVIFLIVLLVFVYLKAKRYL